MRHRSVGEIKQQLTEETRFHFTLICFVEKWKSGSLQEHLTLYKLKTNNQTRVTIETVTGRELHVKGL